MTVIETTIRLDELKQMSEKMFGNIVKAVVDVEKEILIVDAALHADQEEFLLDAGSQQNHLWGINLHPEAFGTEQFVEFDSMINIRPQEGNKSRGVEDPQIQQQVKAIVAKKVSL